MEMEPWDPLDHPARIEVRRQESDDSDAEGGLGNVTRVVLRPPGHSGKAKRGHLCFDASYEGGNLGRVDFISEYEYDLFIRPDTCNPRYRLWFNFVVDNVRADQRVIFNLVNLCKIKTLYRDGMTPLVKTSSRPKWQRLPGKYVYYHKSPEHRNHYILSFAFAFDREEDVYQFAFSFPYSYSRCQAHLELLEQRQFPHFKRETIGASLQNRKLDVITITNLPPSGLVNGKRPKIVVVLARINPGETPTSYIAQGLMDFMVSNHPLATALRDHIIIKIVPMINPDGAFLGNYRTSLMGYDLNRHWNQVSQWSHPTLQAIKNFLMDLDASKTLDLDMVIDLHAHASLMGAFIYGNAYDDVYRFERHILFPKLLAHNAEDYNPSHTMYNRDPNKAGTARRHLCEILRNTVNVYTLEVSYFGYTQALSNAIITYNEDGYLRLGRNLARTFFEYYKATGIILPTVLSIANPGGGDDNDRKNTIRGKGRPKTRSQRGTKGKSRDKSRTRSPSSSNPKDISGPMTTNTNVNDNDNEHAGEIDKTVVKLSQLTREAQHNSADSDSDLDSSEEEVKVRATRNGAIFQQQYIRRRSSSTGIATTANPNLTQSRSQTQTNDENGTNVSHNGGTSHNNRKVQTTTTSATIATIGPRPLVLNFSSSSPQRPTYDAEVKKKTAYQTFDFSILKEHRHHRDADGDDDDGCNKISNPTTRRVRRFTHKRSDGRENARKIGGGGIVGKRKARHRESRGGGGVSGGGGRQGGTSETETEAPCLTIIDFNMLIRKALEGRGHHGRQRGGGGSDGGWRGWSSGHRRLRDRGDREEFGGGHATDGGGGGVSSNGIGGRRRKNNVRRRRAILLRGTVTDCSPWEEEDDDDQHHHHHDQRSSSCDSPSTSQEEEDLDFLRFPSPSSSSQMTKGNLKRHELNLNTFSSSYGATTTIPAGAGGENKEEKTSRGNTEGGGNGRNRRKKSPATPTLSPSPIFLPQ